MLTDLLILTLLAIGCLIALLIAEARHRVTAHGVLRLLWRWHTGQPWHGKPLTDAGWFRPASDRKAFTPTGHAPRFHHYPIWRRTVSRSGRSAGAVLLLLLWVNYPRTAPLISILLGIAIVAYWCWQAWKRWNGRKHRRTWMEPLHVIAAPMVGIPRALPASSWLEIEPDRSRVRALLPPDYNPDDKEKTRVVSTFAMKLGMEGPDPRWQLRGPEHYLELTAAQPPPARVALADVRAELDRLKPDELLWGTGKRGALVTTSLSGDSPHIGLSMGSGAGKSIAARALLAQMLYRGCIGLILDHKMISHQWARGLPNVVIARRPREIHEALIWLGGWPGHVTGEIKRRNEVALAGSDDEGNVHAIVGPRLIVICEELNATMSVLRAYWRQLRNEDKSLQQRSPALDALDQVNLMGRQVMINLVYMGQRLSVKAVGGDGDARESIGVVALGRYTASNWKMLAGDHPMPPASRTPGRIQVVSDHVRETQGVFMTAREARELAVAGTVSLLPAGMPGAPRVTPADLAQIQAPDQGTVTDTAPSGPAPVTPAGPQLVTLAEAAAEGIGGRSKGALRIARWRDSKLPEEARTFPKSRGKRVTADLYDPVELAEWDAGRR